VLLIEDEEAVRFVMLEMLKTFGLTPESAPDGEAGIALFRKNPGAFRLVLMDMLMPGLNGEQTLAGLRAIRPTIDVLLMSGYSEGDILRRLAGLGKLTFLAKPFTRDTLERKLRELLEDAHAA
jgi:two-component system, cell cycle sensor histidine kinase and response regulator CckA